MALDHQELSEYLRENLKVELTLEWRQQGNMERQMLVSQILLYGDVIAEAMLPARSLS